MEQLMGYRIGDIFKVNNVQEHMLIVGYSEVTFPTYAAPRLEYISLETGKRDRASFAWFQSYTTKVA